jgi:hypothetical protein
LQTPRGSGFPESIAEQAPSRPGRLHATQAPLQPMLQQTLSAQLPEMQSLSPLQCAPIPTLPQLPVVRSQECVGSHCPPCAEVQDWKHIPVLVSQVYGMQSICVTPALQAPEPSQANAPSTESPLQVPPTQVLPR